MSEHKCLWKPTDSRPCADPTCPHGVSGFWLIVPVPDDSRELARGRLQRWPDKRYRRVRHESEGEVWFSWMDEDDYDRQFATPHPQEPEGSSK